MGAATLAAGSLVPPKLEGIMVEEFVVLDVQVVRYDHALGMCWLVGMVLCAVAGVLGAIGRCALCAGPALPPGRGTATLTHPVGQPPRHSPLPPSGDSDAL